MVAFNSLVHSAPRNSMPMTPNDPQRDPAKDLKTTSYTAQYARNNAAPLTPFLGVDEDIAVHADVLEENAAVQATRRYQPSGPEVER